MADYRKMARRAAQKYGLDPNIFERQIKQESGFNPNARSPAGAQGIAQIMPATAAGWGVNPSDPKASLNAAAKNMASYVSRYGSYENALRAYNAGPGAIQKSKGYSETNNYVQTILRGRDPGRLGSRTTTGGDDEDEDDGGTPGRTNTRSFTTSTPGVDNRVARAQLVQSFLEDKKADPIMFATQARALRDIAPTSDTTTVTQRYPGTPGGGGGGGGGSSLPTGTGNFKISGPNPARLQPQLKSFARKVADAYGGTLTGLDGSSHSKMTVNGNVSQHYTGNATDIFQIDGQPAQGKRLIQAGRAALIAAGMPRAKAMKAPGGLYNVGNHQIIFGVSGVQNGGDHTDHLHISAR